MYAAATATADAMKPLIQSDMDVEGLFETKTETADQLLVVAMRVGGERWWERFVGGPGGTTPAGFGPCSTP